MSTPNKSDIRVGAVMLGTDKFPVAGDRTLFKEALEEMGRWRLGIICITDSNGVLLGILTDGDIRRKILSVQRPFSSFFVDDALDHCITDPVCADPDMSLKDAVGVMAAKQVWDLPVLDADGQLVGLLHLHAAVAKILDSNP